jgi:hypothetical protein
MRSFCTVLLGAMLTAAGLTSLSHAGPLSEIPDGKEGAIAFCIAWGAYCYKTRPLEGAAPSAAQAPAAVEVPPDGVSAVFKLSNNGATLEPGEPTASGRMNRTIWGNVTVPAASRVVIHTFGTGFDTALAVYRGEEVDALKRLAFNNNFPVAGTYKTPGLAGKQSLVQFDARKNLPYSVQFGSVSGAQGDAYANVFFFSPVGGLAATLVALDKNAWHGQDYACGYGGDFRLPACQSPTFLLYNSTDQPLIVTPSADLGNGIKVPEPVALAPGAATTVTFRIQPGFNKTKVRTVSGHFTFTGRVGDNVVATAQIGALIVVKGPGAQSDVLEMDASPTVQAGHPNEPFTFKVKVKNNGDEEAIGCHARSNTATFPRPHLRTQWRRLDADGTPSGPPNLPVKIQGGKTALFDVIVASHTARVADPEFPLSQTDVIIDCANTQPAPSNLANAFDFSAVGTYAPAKLEVEKFAPHSDELVVPSGGAAFRVSAINRSATTTLRAIPTYIRPFDDCCDPQKQFEVSICETATKNGPCLAAATQSVDYNAEKDKKTFFTVFVLPPAVDPGFDPGRRRVFLKFWHPRPTTQSGFDTVVGAESIAVQRGN